MKNSVIVLFAPPNGGKDIQSNLLLSFFNKVEQPYHYLSTGEYFRGLGVENFTLKKMNQQMAAGSLADDIIVESIVWNFLIKNFRKNDTFILNGYPRNIHQSKELLRQTAFYELERKILIEIVTSEGELEKRRAIREAESHREDDKKQSFDQRMTIFKKERGDILEVLRHSFEIIEIYGDGTPKEVHQNIIRILGYV